MKPCKNVCTRSRSELKRSVMGLSHLPAIMLGLPLHVKLGKCEATLSNAAVTLNWDQATLALC